MVPLLRFVGRQTELARVARLLAVDDLQFSDAATRDLIHDAISRLADHPVGWVLTARPEGPVRSLAHDLQREQPVEPIELEGFFHRSR